MTRRYDRRSEGRPPRRRSTPPPETTDPAGPGAPGVLPVPEDPASLLVRDADGLKDLCHRIRKAGCFGFDTEFIRERSYRPQVCLAQVVTADGFALVDPLGMDLTPLWHLVLDPDVETVVHAGDQDLELCHLCTGRAAANIFDIQVAAGLAGLAYPLSYSRLAHQVLGARIGKGETFSDWSRRPLSASQLKYAVEDVLYLLPLKEHLERDLAARGRMPWLREEMQRLESAATYARQAEDAWQRVRGGDTLSARGRAVLRNLAIWREHEAEVQDLPPRSLLRDEVLVSIARRLPKNVAALHEVRGMPRPLADRCGTKIVRAIENAASAAPLPGPAHRRGNDEDRPQDRMLTDLVAAVAQGLCISGGVAPGLLATRTDYADLVRHITGGAGSGETGPGPGDVVPRLLSGWRKEFAGDAVAAVLSGQKAVRVSRSGDPPGPQVDLIPPTDKQH